MQREDFKSSVAVIGCNKATNEYIAKGVASRLGLRYMDLDGYLKYILGGISPSQALLKCGPDFLMRSMSRAFDEAAGFDGVVMASSALIFCSGADEIIKNCYTFIPQKERVDIRRIDVKLRKFMDVEAFLTNYAVACEMSVLLSGEADENIKAIINFLEETANGGV